jgi:hypothetical protein
MKKKIILSHFLATLVAFLPIRGKAQAYELERLVLDIEKLAQLKAVLTNLYKDYEVLENGYTAIRNIAEGNFNLHKLFLDGLLAVSPAVQKYERIVDIISDQEKILSEYKSAYSIFKQDKHFTPDDLVYLSTVYNNLVTKSEKNLENLFDVITASKLRMNDAERLEAIDAIYRDTHDELIFLRQFDNRTAVLATQRAKQEEGIGTVKGLYDLP